jgi:putative transposase
VAARERPLPGSDELQLVAEPRAVDATPPRARGWYTGNHLPHFDGRDTVQHVTFHLADSIPRAARERIERQIVALPDAEQQRERRKHFQSLLDAGMGDCVLRQPWAATLLEEALLHFHQVRYRLDAWVVMPNHVHALVMVLPGFALGRIVQSWKSYTARRINSWRRAGARRSQGVTAPDASGAVQGDAVWHRDFWDRYIRDEPHYLNAVEYIETNPVTAGLVSEPRHWRWGSSRFRSGS